MQNPKTKPKFQTTEDYLKDYEAYKQGYTYKIIVDNKPAVFSRDTPLCCSCSIYSKLSAYSFQVVDLKHKFRQKSCKNPVKIL